MSDLISRQAAIKAIEDLQDCYNGFSDTYDKACIIGVIEEVPTVEPKHGRWIVNNETNEWVTIWCDQCHDGMWNRKDEPYPNYCFSCGARMDEGE